jgi:hypothetical protein
MADDTNKPPTPETNQTTPASRMPGKKDEPQPSPYKPNLGAIFAVFAVSIGVSLFILVYAPLRQNQPALVIAGILMALAVSVILFSIVPSTALVRTVVGFGGAALFFNQIWPEVNKAIVPGPTFVTFRGSIYYVAVKGNDGLRPVQGALVTVPKTGLKAEKATGEGGDFVIMDAPPNLKELEVHYRDRVYPLDLTKFENQTRYPVIPSDAPSPADTVSNQRLPEGYVMDATVETFGPYFERITANIPDAYIDASGNANRYRICAQPQADYVVDATRDGFHGGLRVAGPVGGDNYHSELWDGDCFVLYAAGNNGRGSNSWAKGLQVALKRLHSPAPCGRAEKMGTKLAYSGVNQIQLDIGPALGPCVGPDLPSQPKWTTTAIFKKPDGGVVNTARFEGFDQTQALNGIAALWMSTSALLSVALKERQ